MTNTHTNGTAPGGTAPNTTASGGTAPNGTAPNTTAPGGTAPNGVPPETPTEVDLPRIEAAVTEILHAIGEDPHRPGLLDTPARVARAYQEAFEGLRQKPEDLLDTTFDIDHDELVLVRDVSFYSTCEHHLVPFFGVAHIGYIPSAEGHVTGLSKLARLVDIYAKRPQVQEQLTTQIVNALEEHLKPRGAIVVLEGEHLCMSMRGVNKPGAKTITSAVRGHLRNPATRSEAMSLIMQK